MKTSSKILVAALFGAALTTGSFAGPGVQYWQNHGATVIPATTDTVATLPSDNVNGVKCETMTDGTIRVSREITKDKIVTCTPEMMLNNPRCKVACGM